MNITLKYRWIALGFAGLLSTAAVIQAQSEMAAVAQVPFRFNIGNTRMPAATYRLSKVTTDGAMQIQDTANRHSVMFWAMAPKAARRPFQAGVPMLWPRLLPGRSLVPRRSLRPCFEGGR